MHDSVFVTCSIKNYTEPVRQNLVYQEIKKQIVDFTRLENVSEIVKKSMLLLHLELMHTQNSCMFACLTDAR